MDEIPDDLRSVKRSVLQKLCKRLGIKANGKNVDMIQSLSELKAKRSSPVLEEDPAADPLLPPSPQPLADQCSNISTEVSVSTANASTDQSTMSDTATTSPNKAEAANDDWMKPPTSPVRETGAKRKARGRQTKSKTTKKGKGRGSKGKKGGKSAKGRRGSGNEPPQSPKSEDHNALSPVASEHTNTAMAPLSSPPSFPTTETSLNKHNTPTLCKRKRRDTYSISPSNSSFLGGDPPSAKQARVESQPQPEGINEDEFEMDRQECPVGSLGSATCAVTTPTSEDAPFSPPTSSDRKRPRSNPKRKRNSTFTVNTNPEGDEKNIPSDTAEPLNITPDVSENENEPQSKKRRRHSTCNLSPSTHKESMETVTSSTTMCALAPTDVSEATTTTHTSVDVAGDSEASSVEGNSDTGEMEQMLGLLEKRVQERKADPNYKPTDSSSSLASKIPIKTSTARKFDKAHEKQFGRMTSIISYQKRRDKLRVSVKSRPPPCENRSRTKANVPPRDSVKRPLTSQSGENSSPVKKMKKKSLTSKCRASTAATGFKPTVMSTKNASFDFKSEQSTQQKKAEFKPSVLSTKNANFEFTKSEVKTPAAKKPVGHTQGNSFKTPGKVSSSSFKTPGKTVKFTDDLKNSSRKSCVSTKKAPYDLQGSLKKAKKPNYKPYCGKLPPVEIPRY